MRPAFPAPARLLEQAISRAIAGMPARIIRQTLAGMGRDQLEARLAAERFGRLSAAQRKRAAAVTAWCPASCCAVAQVFPVGGRMLVWLAGGHRNGLVLPGRLLPPWMHNQPEWLDAGIGSGWTVTCRCSRAALWVPRTVLAAAVADRQRNIRVAPRQGQRYVVTS